MLLVELDRDDAIGVARRPLRHIVGHVFRCDIPPVRRDHAVSLEERVQLHLHRSLVVLLVEEAHERVVPQHEVERRLRPGRTQRRRLVDDARLVRRQHGQCRTRLARGQKHADAVLQRRPFDALRHVRVVSSPAPPSTPSTASARSSRRRCARVGGLKAAGSTAHPRRSPSPESNRATAGDSLSASASSRSPSVPSIPRF